MHLIESDHQQSLDKIFQEIVQCKDYTEKIHSTLAKIIVHPIDQTTERDMTFATRLIEEYEVVTKSIDGKLVRANEVKAKAITCGNTPYCCYS